MSTFGVKKFLRLLSIIAVLLATITIILIVRRYYLPPTTSLGSTTISLSSSSQNQLPITKKFGEIVNLDIHLDTQGKHVSIITLDILYNPNSLQLIENSFRLNSAIPNLTTLENLVISKNSFSITLNVGGENTKDIFETKLKLASFAFKVIGTKTESTTVSFSNKTQSFSVSEKNQAGENIPTDTKNIQIRITEIKISSPSASPTNTKNQRNIFLQNSTSSAKTASTTPSIIPSRNQVDSGIRIP